MNATELAHVFVEYHNKTALFKKNIDIVALRTYASEMYDAINNPFILRSVFIGEFLEEVSFLLGGK